MEAQEADTGTSVDLTFPGGAINICLVRTKGIPIGNECYMQLRVGQTVYGRTSRRPKVTAYDAEWNDWFCVPVPESNEFIIHGHLVFEMYTRDLMKIHNDEMQATFTIPVSQFEMPGSKVSVPNIQMKSPQGEPRGTVEILAHSVHAGVIKKYHRHARSQEHPDYPDRAYVPDEYVTFDRVFKYANPDQCEYTHPSVTNVMALDPRVATPAGMAQARDYYVHHKIVAIHEPFTFNDEFDATPLQRGRPLNPHGRTGLTGRGILYNWGPNLAMDTILTRTIMDESGAHKQVLVMKRPDSTDENPVWGIPGSMAVRQRFNKFMEKTASEMMDLDVRQRFTSEWARMQKAATTIYRGYVDDPRNTDNAWMETEVKHMPCEHWFSLMIPVTGDYRWIDVDGDEPLFADHKAFVKICYLKMQMQLGALQIRPGTFSIPEMVTPHNAPKSEGIVRPTFKYADLPNGDYYIDIVRIDRNVKDDVVAKSSVVRRANGRPVTWPEEEVLSIALPPLDTNREFYDTRTPPLKARLHGPYWAMRARFVYGEALLTFHELDFFRAMRLPSQNSRTLFHSIRESSKGDHVFMMDAAAGQISLGIRVLHLIAQPANNGPSYPVDVVPQLLREANRRIHLVIHDADWDTHARALLATTLKDLGKHQRNTKYVRGGSGWDPCRKTLANGDPNVLCGREEGRDHNSSRDSKYLHEHIDDINWEVDAALDGRDSGGKGKFGRAVEAANLIKNRRCAEGVGVLARLHKLSDLEAGRKAYLTCVGMLRVHFADFSHVAPEALLSTMLAKVDEIIEARPHFDALLRAAPADFAFLDPRYLLNTIFGEAKKFVDYKFVPATPVTLPPTKEYGAGSANPIKVIEPVDLYRIACAVARKPAALWESYEKVVRDIPVPPATPGTPAPLPVDFALVRGTAIPDKVNSLHKLMVDSVANVAASKEIMPSFVAVLYNSALCAAVAKDDLRAAAAAAAASFPIAEAPARIVAAALSSVAKHVAALSTPLYKYNQTERLGIYANVKAAIYPMANLVKIVSDVLAHSKTTNDGAEDGCVEKYAVLVKTLEGHLEGVETAVAALVSECTKLAKKDSLWERKGSGAMTQGELDGRELLEYHYHLTDFFMTLCSDPAVNICDESRRKFQGDGDKHGVIAEALLGKLHKMEKDIDDMGVMFEATVLENSLAQTAQTMTDLFAPGAFNPVLALIRKHSSFGAANYQRKLVSMTYSRDIDRMIRLIQGDHIDRVALNNAFLAYSKTFEPRAEEGARNKDVAVKHIKEILQGIFARHTLSGGADFQWDSEFCRNLPTIIGEIAALWSILVEESYNKRRNLGSRPARTTTAKENKLVPLAKILLRIGVLVANVPLPPFREVLDRVLDSVVAPPDQSNAVRVAPHVGQVVAIFRLLGVGFGSNWTAKNPEFKDLSRLAPYNLDYGKLGAEAAERAKKVPPISPALLANHLAEVKTGEGKSVVLAVTACVFALAGFTVSCSCYSDYLSQRDKKDFEKMFAELGVAGSIEYGTFGTLCENLLNRECHIRNSVYASMMPPSGKQPLVQPQGVTDRGQRKQVLLIDEVDVFLSSQYYGQSYEPAVQVPKPVPRNTKEQRAEVAAKLVRLMRWVWGQYKSAVNKRVAAKDALMNDDDFEPVTFDEVKVTAEYQALVGDFVDWNTTKEPIIEVQVRLMLAALQTFKRVACVVNSAEGRIMHQDGDGVSQNIVMGYNTMWLYFQKVDEGMLQPGDIDNNVSMIVQCGIFSFAELPLLYSFVGGVSGTLRQLADKEHEILQRAFNIKTMSIIPSVYADEDKNKRDVNDSGTEQMQVKVFKKTDNGFFVALVDRMNLALNANRAVLIFFETKQRLEEFQEFLKKKLEKSILDSIQVVHEEVQPELRQDMINNAGQCKRLTLLTKNFGRGTDFIILSPDLKEKGILCIQTFFSQELSEEIQIMGRCARQGDPGSFRIMLLQDDLASLLPDWETHDNVTYEQLNAIRHTNYAKACNSREANIKTYHDKHNAAIAFTTDVRRGDGPKVRQYLFEVNNPGVWVDPALVKRSVTRTLLLIDATGSMGAQIQQCKDTITMMIEAANKCMADNKITTGVELQIAAYRNYNVKDEKLLEKSKWESNPSNLRKFLAQLQPDGGMGNEAIEVALAHACEEAIDGDAIGKPLSQIILIGDAPPNTKEEVIEKMKRARGGVVKAYAELVDHYKQMERIKVQGKAHGRIIPIHAFYVAKPSSGQLQWERCRTAFKEIGERSGGSSAELVNHEVLTWLVTQEIIKSVSGSDAGMQARLLTSLAKIIPKPRVV